jgi:hypothetical protein
MASKVFCGDRKIYETINLKSGGGVCATIHGFIIAGIPWLIGESLGTGCSAAH